MRQFSALAQRANVHPCLLPGSGRHKAGVHIAQFHTPPTAVGRPSPIIKSRSPATTRWNAKICKICTNLCAPPFCRVYAVQSHYRGIFPRKPFARRLCSPGTPNFSALPNITCGPGFVSLAAYIVRAQILHTCDFRHHMRHTKITCSVCAQSTI